MYAPLIIDDVLADLSSSLKHASITLSNASESQPFYRSAPSNNSESLNKKLVRDIFVLGQQWRMELTPDTSSLNALAQWDISWVVAIGLSLTGLTLFIFALLRNNDIAQEPGSNRGAAPINTITYLNSALFKHTLLPLLVLVLSIFLLSSWLIVQNRLSTVKNDLLQISRVATDTVNKKASKYRQDVSFLASTPPINALIKLSERALNASNSSDSIRFKERLAEIFEAYMLATPEAHQARLIVAANDWQEAVRVQRNNSALVTLEDHLLQSKKDEPYIANTLDVRGGQVYTSDINLNREFGSIEYPERPTWRFSTAVYHQDGSPYGIIIININAKELLKEVASTAGQEIQLYATNSHHEFLLHPSSSRAFSFERGLSYTWEDEFKPASWWHLLDRSNLTSLRSTQGRVWAEKNKFRWMTYLTSAYLTSSVSKLSTPYSRALHCNRPLFSLS